MEETSYRSILKRVGTVLVLVGLADIGWMVYCIIHNLSYSSMGVGLVICGTVAMNFVIGGETAQRMISMAEKDKSIAGVVTAWNNREIREVPVHWEEGRNP
jgi:hypothetical protein